MRSGTHRRTGVGLCGRGPLSSRSLAMAEPSIRDAETGDVEAITAIQNAFIGSAAIEWTNVEYSVDERRAWLESQRAAGYPVLVAVRAGEVVGWASFGEFRDAARWPGYRLTVEHTIHVRHDQWGRGVGRKLIDALVERATALGFHVMVAAIDGENAASLLFHQRVGFIEVARMPQVGTKFGRWLDLVLLQRVLGEAAPPE
jgi:L-amino acid N-acyltransferase YncA